MSPWELGLQVGPAGDLAVREPTGAVTGQAGGPGMTWAIPAQPARSQAEKE